jgi:hypothetical protein
VVFRKNVIHAGEVDVLGVYEEAVHIEDSGSDWARLGLILAVGNGVLWRRSCLGFEGAIVGHDS